MVLPAHLVLKYCSYRIFGFFFGVGRLAYGYLFLWTLKITISLKKKKVLPQSYFLKANIQKPQPTLEQTLSAPGSDYAVSFFLPLLTTHWMFTLVSSSARSLTLYMSWDCLSAAS